jgi:shikimate dehydrogenase
MKRFGLIGYPLNNSFSKDYFNSKFLTLGLMEYEYQNYPIEDLNDIPKVLKQATVNGFNITIPYKEIIIPLMDELDESAEKVGAVNCVHKTKEGKLIGYNTDVYGFKQSLIPLIAHKPIEHALILGTGGAAKAVAFVLQSLNINYTFVSRKNDVNHLLYKDVSLEIISHTQLIINCTPIGMFPNTDAAPNIPYQCLNEKHIVFDLIYLPIETKFLQLSKHQKAITQNGLEMLHLQAEKSWEIWMK